MVDRGPSAVPPGAYNTPAAATGMIAATIAGEWEYVVIAVPAAVALSFAGIVGYWLRSRRR